MTVVPADQPGGQPGGGEVAAAGSPVPRWDVFLSYVRSDGHATRPLVEALRGHGLRVFVDDSAIADFTSISDTISREMAASKVLLAYYSHAYPRRRACQWELRAAYLAGQQEGDPRRRVLVVNPEPHAEHIQPVELRDARHWPEPRGEAALAEFATNVRAHAETVTGSMAAIGRRSPTRWLPAPGRAGTRQFTGRLTELWQVHTALHRHVAPLTTGRSAAATGAAQIRGMGGIGKTALAEEYALRFHAAYPGGIYWLRADAAAGGELDGRVLSLYQAQVRTVAAALGIDATPTTSAPLEDLLSRLAVALHRAAQPFLWVVDGLPGALRPETAQLLRTPHPLGATLFTTRGHHNDSLAVPVDLTPLTAADAYRLLTAWQAPASADDEQAAQGLAHDLGGHPLALTLAGSGSAQAGQTFQELRALLHHPTRNLIDELATVPPGHPSHLGDSLLADVSRLPASGLDVLRIAAALAPAPVTRPLLEGVLAAVDGTSAAVAARRSAAGLAGLLAASLVEPRSGRSGSWAVHPLLAYAVRRWEPQPVRAEMLRRAALEELANPDRASNRASMSASRTGFAHAPQEPSMRTRPPGPAPSDIERMAAFDLQVELVTRVGVQRLGNDEGSLREALASLHSLFHLTRQILRQHGPGPAGGHDEHHDTDVHILADELLNRVLRPFLNHWHPTLTEHEAHRPPDLSAPEHEKSWAGATAMRDALNDLHEPLTRLAQRLAAISGTNLGLTGTP